jgi:dUTPase
MQVKIINKTEFELPKYETTGSAGMDLRANLKPKKNDTIILEPYIQQVVPTGIFIKLPNAHTDLATGQSYGHEAQIRPRSGLAAKHGITVVNAPGTIDCFSEDSTITTPNGEIKIDNIKIGDIVLSSNDDNMEIEKDTIDAIVDTGFQDILIIETENGVLEITPNTLVYTENEIKMAHELNLNDNIIHFVKLTKIKSIKKDKKQTYDITVRKNHNFFCNNHLIHNCDYTGEIKVILMNLTNKPFTINHGDRIAQMVVNRYEKISFVEVDTLEKTERGAGGFGSTGKK